VAVFDGIPEGPSAEAVIYDYGRSTSRTIQQIGLMLFILVYVAIGVAGGDWAAPFTQWWPLTLAPVLITFYGSLRRFTRRHYGLALDPHGIWFRDGRTFFHIPWDTIRQIDGRSYESDGASGVWLDIRDPNQCPGLAETRGRAKPRTKNGHTRVRLPMSGNLSSLARDLDRLAPQVNRGKHWGIYRRGRKTP
jgi:hypothetical protein